MKEFLTATKMSLVELSRRASVSYGTLHRHHKHGYPLGLKVARKLASVSVVNDEGVTCQLSIASVLNLEPPANEPKRRRTSAAA